MLISMLCSTQQQALLGTMAVMMPAVVLAVYTSPIENIPGWLQAVTCLNPLRYMRVIVKGIFLKGIPAEVVLANIWPMAAIAAGTLSLATWSFRRHLA